MSQQEEIQSIAGEMRAIIEGDPALTASEKEVAKAVVNVTTLFLISSLRQADALEKIAYIMEHKLG